MSELVREACRHYERKKWWEEMNAYGRAKAQELGLSEADVVPLVKEVRTERRERRSSRRPDFGAYWAVPPQDVQVSRGPDDDIILACAWIRRLRSWSPATRIRWP